MQQYKLLLNDDIIGYFRTKEGVMKAIRKHFTPTNRYAVHSFDIEDLSGINIGNVHFKD